MIHIGIQLTQKSSTLTAQQADKRSIYMKIGALYIITFFFHYKYSIAINSTTLNQFRLQHLNGVQQST